MGYQVASNPLEVFAIIYPIAVLPLLSLMVFLPIRRAGDRRKQRSG